MTEPIGVLKLLHNLDGHHEDGDEEEMKSPDSNNGANPMNINYLQNHKITNIQYMEWMNQLLPEHLLMRNLDRDLLDGVVVLTILEQMSPGIVDWKMLYVKC